MNPALAALLLGITVSLTACGSDNAGPDTELSATEHNAADVSFASGMIQHHAQALAMVDLTMGRDLDPEVTALAEEVRAAQAPEIELMVDWLGDWDEEVPETVRDHANAGHGDSGAEVDHEVDHGDMPGMMSADDMEALEDASDAEFEDLWLTMMIEHHEGAVVMATTETSDGQYEPAVDLASEIVEAQAAEIETMKGLLP